MADTETFNLASDLALAVRQAEAAFRVLVRELEGLLPASAEVRHAGATAIAGCVTKGDLDIVVRVDAADFARAEASLAGRFQRNAGSIRTTDFASFEDPARTPPVGVQLTVKGGAFDVFHLFTDALNADPALVRRYNELKLTFAGRPMADYRLAKDAFVAEVLARLRLAGRP